MSANATEVMAGWTKIAQYAERSSVPPAAITIVAGGNKKGKTMYSYAHTQVSLVD